ncbi:MAG: YceI family protein [Nocardioidaceae bacterium]
MTSTLVSQFEGLQTGTYVIDPSHSEVGFTVRHLMSKVRGQFREFEGTITVAADNPLESSAEATIELSSVDTRNSDRDNHLRSGDFFSVETSPKMTFRSTGVRSTGVRSDGGSLVATGELTIKDVTKPVELELDYLGAGSDPWGGSRVGFEGTTTISRKEWGVDFNIPLEGDKLMIGDKVNVVLAVEAVLQTAETPEG